MDNPGIKLVLSKAHFLGEGRLYWKTKPKILLEGNEIKVHLVFIKDIFLCEKL